MRDVDAVLERAAESLTELRDEYERTLREHQVTPKLQAMIKNIVENQRAALDYVAWAIADRWGTANRKTYYPLAQSASDFASDFNKKLPGVTKARPDVRDAVERHQPYNQPWLRHLSALVIQNKHRHLTPQKKSEERRREYPLRPGEGEVHTLDEPIHPPGVGVLLGGGRLSYNPDLVEIDPGGGIWAKGVPIHEVGPIVVYVGWAFVDPPVPVLATLETIQKGVTSAALDICGVAGL